MGITQLGSKLEQVWSYIHEHNMKTKFTDEIDECVKLTFRERRVRGEEGKLQNVWVEEDCEECTCEKGERRR